ncbi:hypothetical protein Trco_007879 [Trichoderma cornu-damae]|uniref:Uncharacterized protein n=1 Tax=Trichoderma cornu-damae TaxID=654480 RepID=A0A9P8TTM4_9HYPO|nr:hypothetical protein Trco_007879 [Trichoderma cornu-damae]
MLLFCNRVHGVYGVYGVEGHSMNTNEDFAIAGFGNRKFSNRDVIGRRSENECLHFDAWFGY